MGLQLGMVDRGNVWYDESMWHSLRVRFAFFSHCGCSADKAVLWKREPERRYFETAGLAKRECKRAISGRKCSQTFLLGPMAKTPF